MASIAPFFERLKPALDNFLQNSTRKNLECLQKEIQTFDWLEAKIVHIHVLLPLLLKLEELKGKDQELRTELINCISLVISNVYLVEVKSLATVLTIILKQVHNFEKATTLENLSEEIKLAAVQCIGTAFERTTTDALEAFYDKKSASLLGHILLFLVELIEFDYYRKIKLAALECLSKVFYVHDNANFGDIVLRENVANTLFIYLPKVIGVLFKLCTGDDKLGETLKSHSIKTFGRILQLVYEDTNELKSSCDKTYNSKDFQKLLQTLKENNNTSNESYILEGNKIDRDKLEEKLARLQNNGRSRQWFKQTSARLKGIFKEMLVLRSHLSAAVRQEFAQMCANLLENCAENLKVNFLILLENLLALAEDEDEEIATICANSLKRLQQQQNHDSIFDECADLLFEEHSMKILHIINRNDEYELYAELLFLKGFFRNVAPNKLTALFSLNSLMQNFCMALITVVDLNTSAQFLSEEFALRKFDESVYLECFKLKWRQYRYLDCQRCLLLTKQICAILGSYAKINSLLFHYFFELLQNHSQRRMNEALLILTWMFAPTSAEVRKKPKKLKMETLGFADLILAEIFKDCHWNLALHPDEISRLKVNKPSNWFVDATPGLYESRYEIRVQDYDSDDEEQAQEQVHVTFSDAQWNVLHTCITLDAVGHFATYLGSSFSKHIFRVLHKVLLKVACSNTLVYEAGVFALVSLQRALAYDNINKFIENHTDYISHQLNMLLRKTPDSSAAVDILSVVLQLSSQRSLPHLENIFETLRNECSQTHQKQNISAYLKVFNVFLVCIERWQNKTNEMNFDIKAANKMKANITTSINALNCEEILKIWLQAFNKSLLEINEPETMLTDEGVTVNEATNETEIDNENNEEEEETTMPENGEEQSNECKVELPRHIEMVKQILQETLKFLPNSNQSQQILSLECLIVGVPLLKDYEDVLLPLVHAIWQPLLEKFRQKDPLVLNRCFTLLNVLSTHAKNFILKRSLDNVMPYLKAFMKDSAKQSAAEQLNAKTQLYKLQLKLLQEFSNLIITMQIDGKHFIEIAEVIALYLSNKQPKEFQQSAVKFFLDLRAYDGPIVYLVNIKRLHLKDFEKNANKIIVQFGIETIKMA